MICRLCGDFVAPGVPAEPGRDGDRRVAGRLCCRPGGAGRPARHHQAGAVMTCRIELTIRRAEIKLGVWLVIVFALFFWAMQIWPPAHGAELQRPYSCRLLDDAERQCAFGQCDARLLERLRRECLRDGGRP
jgi:hypothetical protein